METVKNNKLIVKILDWKPYKYGYDGFSKPKEDEERYKTPFTWNMPDVASFQSERNDFDVRYMPFDTDWNWLNELQTAIEKLGYIIEIKSGSFGAICKINMSGSDIVIVDKVSKSKIEAVYTACMKLVKSF